MAARDVESDMWCEDSDYCVESGTDSSDQSDEFSVQIQPYQYEPYASDTDTDQGGNEEPEGEGGLQPFIPPDMQRFLNTQW